MEAFQVKALEFTGVIVLAIFVVRLFQQVWVNKIKCHHELEMEQIRNAFSLVASDKKGEIANLKDQLTKLSEAHNNAINLKTEEIKKVQLELEEFKDKIMQGNQPEKK